MLEGFAPQFFLLIGIDIFLGASIVTVLLDDHFPGGLPYILELGAFVGFAQLLLGPSFPATFSTTLQFYYCFAYSVLAALSVLGANLLLLFVKRKIFSSGFVAIVATAPSFLANLFFASAYVNGLSLELPILPVLPISWIYVIFFLTAALLLTLMIGVAYQAKKNN